VTERTFKHSGKRGDLVYGLPAMKALGGGKLLINVSSCFFKDDSEVELFRELLKGQDGVDGVEAWDGSEPTYDLDGFREMNIVLGSLTTAHLERFGVSADLSEPWLEVEPKHVADVVVNRTSKYHGLFSWYELREWQDRCVFVGTEDEHGAFLADTGLEMPRHETGTYLELARVIAGSRLFVGNQSFPYALSEALKVPRILEVFSACPNCNPVGPNGFTGLSQSVLMRFLEG
jgi:hypothetical protein